MFAEARVKSCNVASAVSMDCVVTNTSRDACARGGGQVAAKTGETKTGEARIAVAAKIKPIGLGIVRVSPRWQAVKHAKANPASAQAQDRCPPVRRSSSDSERSFWQD